MTTLGPLIYAKYKTLANTLSRSGNKTRGTVFVVMGMISWAGVFGASYWFLNQCQRIEIFGDVLIEQLLAMSLLILFSVLVFSNVVSSFSTYFLDDDLRFLMARPLRPYGFFSARFFELMSQSGWMVGLFSLPVFLSIGLVYDLSGGFYFLLVLVLPPIFVIATGLASILSLVLANVLPARRTREILLLLAALTFVALFILLRSLRPERFLNPDERAGIVEVLSTLSAPRLSLLPSEWVHRTLWPAVMGFRERSLFYVGCLYSSAGALYFVAGWLFRLLHADGYSKACEGRHEGAAPERLLRRLFRRNQNNQTRGKRTFASVKGQHKIDFFSEMRRKDALTFIRDTAQWTQLLLLGALVAIYLLNFRYIQTLGEGGIIGPVGLYFCNLGLAGFVATAIAVRFVFPLVSLEGRAFWLIRSAPLSTHHFLLAKWRAAVLPIWCFTQLLTMTSNLMIDAGPTLILVSVVIQTPITLGLVGLGIGLGALYPKFTSTNAAQIATGFGGFAYMVSGVILTIISLALSAHPTLVLRRLLDPEVTATSFNPLWPVLLGVFALTLAPAVAWIVVRWGAKRL